MCIERWNEDEGAREGRSRDTEEELLVKEIL